MSRTLPILTAVLLSLLFVAFAACGGGDEEGTGTPARPTAANATPSPTTPSGASATQTAPTATGAGATPSPTTPSGAGATQTAATPTEAGATQTAGTPAEATATEVAAPTPTTPSFSGGATATVTVGGQTITFTGGKCDLAPDETWLAVNIEQADSGYFGLLVGSNEAAPAGARPVTGGGVFTDGELTLTVEHGDSTFLLGGLGAAGQASTVTLAPDLQSGEFQGNTLFDNQPISGSFHC
jgi:hypothetical protein